MVGAYRCPVCGIDFPSGTRGAPKAASSPGDADLSGVERDAPRAEPAGFAEALDEALGIRPQPPAGEREPETDDAAVEEANAEPVDEAHADGGLVADRSRPNGTASLDVRPSEAAPRAAGSVASLSVRPGRESKSVVVHQAEADASPAVRPRRTMAKGLGRTLVVALVLIAAVGAGVWWTSQQVNVPAAIGLAGPSATTVGAADGWVTLPTSDTGLTVTADGPFRLRVAGKVYTLDGSQPVRVPPGVATSVRIVRSPTSATVMPAQ